jgi:hypothetical protein
VPGNARCSPESSLLRPLDREFRLPQRLLRKGRRGRRTGFAVGEAVTDTANPADLSHEAPLRVLVRGESSHHRVTHRIVGPFVQQPP